MSVLLFPLFTSIVAKTAQTFFRLSRFPALFSPDKMSKRKVRTSFDCIIIQRICVFVQVQKTITQFCTKKADDGVEPAAKRAKAVKKDKPEGKPVNQTSTDFGKIDLGCSKLSKDGKQWNLKISNWNVVSLKALAKKNGLEFVEKDSPDIMCFQETKCNEKTCPEEAQLKGYHRYFVSGEKSGYAGVALYSKMKPIDIKFGLGDKEQDSEGRIITAEYEKFYLVTAYVPNAGKELFFFLNVFSG